MIKEKDGEWLASCDICSWRTSKKERKDAQRTLANHMNTVHRKAKRRIRKQRLPFAPGNLSPQPPSPQRGR